MRSRSAEHRGRGKILQHCVCSCVKPERRCSTTPQRPLAAALHPREQQALALQTPQFQTLQSGEQCSVGSSHTLTAASESSTGDMSASDAGDEQPSSRHAASSGTPP
jgi:hypothetical protein